MKTSYKIALAFCLVLLATAITYRVIKKSNSGHDALLADGSNVPANSTDPLSTAVPPPAATPAPDAPIFSNNTPPAPVLNVAPASLTPTPTPSPAPAPSPTPSTATVTPPPAPTLPPAAPEAKPVVKPAAPAGRIYTVKSGDTLSSISQKFFGDQKHSDEIYNANRKTIGANPNRLKLGQKLTIPTK